MSCEFPENRLSLERICYQIISKDFPNSEQLLLSSAAPDSMPIEPHASEADSSLGMQRLLTLFAMFFLLTINSDIEIKLLRL